MKWKTVKRCAGEILDRNPADGADSPRAPRKEMHALDREGLTRLLTLLRGNKLYLPVLLAATTGMRRGEIMALRWSDIDLDARVLRVARSVHAPVNSTTTNSG